MAVWTWEDVQTAVRAAMEDRREVLRHPGLAKARVNVTKLRLTGAQLLVYKEVAERAMNRETKLFAALALDMDPANLAGVAIGSTDLDTGQTRIVSDPAPKMQGAMKQALLNAMRADPMPADQIRALMAEPCNDPNCMVHGEGGILALMREAGIVPE